MTIFVAMRRQWFVLGLLMLGFASVARAESAPGIPPETPEQRDARMKWWRDARFGMFIHWGLYAIPGGRWKGQPVGGAGEWIMNTANIPVEEYELLAKQFNPVKYNPAQWVKIAKEAGMRYIVITSKHHDGFCLFDSKVTTYDVVDATPWGKDLLKPLAEECRKQGLHFCTYYSIMDWHHPAQMRGSDRAYNPTRIREGRKREYMDYMKAQLKELLESCKPEVLWFDGEWPDWYTEEDGREIYAYLRELDPKLIINNRVGKCRKGMEGLNQEGRQCVGDFGTPEQQIPASGLPGVDWESCMTMNDTWGFKYDDHNWKSTQTLIRNLIDCASKGGNYLLNVGPTAEGEIPAPSVERLQGIGQWLRVNGESIYATQASPWSKQLPWGRCTQKKLDDGTTRLYLHVFTWPEQGRLELPNLKNDVSRAFLLANGTGLTAHRDGDKVVLENLPQKPLDPVATVICVDIKGTPQVD
jgi:alpha-L-fucosidase